MKSLRHILLALLFLSFSTFALADCRVLIPSSVAPVDGGTATAPALLTPNTAGVPFSMALGGTSEATPDIVIYDDGFAPTCFQPMQKITVTYSGPIASPSSLTLANVAVFDTSNATSFTGSLTNGLQGGQVQLQNVAASGASGDVTVGATGSALVLHNIRLNVSQLQLGSNVNAAVTASAGALGSRSLTIGSITAAGPISISAAQLTFAGQIVNTTTTQTVQVANQGSLPVTFSSIATSGTDFSQTNTCGTSLAANASCTITVSFTPTDVGQRAGTLTLTDNTATSPQVITLGGIGAASPGTPVVSGLSPNQVVAGGPTFTLLVSGSNFALGSTVLVNGAARPTTFVNATTLQTSILGADIAATGSVNVSVSNGGTATSNVLPLQIVANPLPTGAFVYALPHVVQGTGFVTKITITNLSAGLQSNVTVRFLSQSGAVVSTTTAQLPAAGTVRLSTPESARFGPYTVQWAAVASDTPLSINLFFELKNSSGQVVNSIGFNNTTPLTNFSVPVEFERVGSGNNFIRSVGVAFANMSDTSSQINLSILSTTGAQTVGSYGFTLPPYGQTAIDLTQVPAIANLLPAGNFVGTLAVSASQPVAAIALGDDIGPFASTPVVQGRATLRVNDIAQNCPSAAAVQQLNADFAISFVQDANAGTLVCRAKEGSADLTQTQLRAYQALLVIRNLVFDAPLPFTAGANLYDWLKSSVLGIRFVGNQNTSSCCATAKVLDIAASPATPALQATAWLGPLATNTNAGLDTMVADIVRLARLSQGVADTCGANDNTTSEMGPWAAALDFYDFAAFHSGAFFDDTLFGIEGIDRYRAVAAQNSATIIANNFCANPGLTQVQPVAGIDFGSQPVGDPAALRTVVVTPSAATPVAIQASFLSGTNANEFAIVSDTCAGQTLPGNSPGPSSCVIVVGFKPTTADVRTATLIVGTPPLTPVPLTGTGVAQGVLPAMAHTYVLPHVVTGNNGGLGYVTKITIDNLVGVSNTVVVTFLSQSGTVVSSNTYALAAGGSLRIATPESARFGTATTQWAVVSSRQPVLANLFFEVESPNGTIVNTIGFNAQDPLATFLFPVEFEPDAQGNPGGRTAGVALANPTASSVNAMLVLYNTAGGQIASYTVALPAYSQTSINLGTISAFTSALPKSNFVGSVRVTATAPISAIALEADFGPFSATPLGPF